MDLFIGLVNRPWFFLALGGAFAAYLLTLSVVLAVWTSRDLQRRTTSRAARVATALFVFAFGIVGFVAYVALRPKRTLEERVEEQRERALLARAVSRASCPSCSKEVETDFASCPFCKVDFAPVCTGCGGILQLSWKRCGFCATDVPVGLQSRKFAEPKLLDLDLLEAQIIAAAPEPAKSAKPLNKPLKLKAPRFWPTPKKAESVAPKSVAKSVPAIEGTSEKLSTHEPEPASSNLTLTLRRMFAIKR